MSSIVAKQRGKGGRDSPETEDLVAVAGYDGDDGVEDSRRSLLALDRVLAWREGKSKVSIFSREKRTKEVQLTLRSRAVSKSRVVLDVGSTQKLVVPVEERKRQEGRARQPDARLDGRSVSQPKS